MPRRPTPERQRELDELRDVFTIVCAFLDEQAPVQGASWVDAVTTSHARHDLVGMRMLRDDLVASLVGLSAVQRRELDRRLREGPGTTLDALEVKLLERIARVREKGRITSETQYYMVRERIEVIWDDPARREEFDALQSLVARYERRATRRAGTNTRAASPATPPAVPPTRLTRHIAAPRAAVYRALLDPHALARWRVPNGMTCVVHEWEPRVGGTLRVSLTYEEPTGAGKTTAHTDTYGGRFVELVPDERVVEVDRFESADPALQGEMTITITLVDAEGGTRLTAVHEGLPESVSAADNEAGWTMALDKLAALVEGGGR